MWKTKTEFQQAWYQKIADGGMDNCQVEYCKHCGKQLNGTR